MTVMIIQYRFGLSLIDNSTTCMMFNPRPVIPLVIAAARLLHHIVNVDAEQRMIQSSKYTLSVEEGVLYWP